MVRVTISKTKIFGRNGYAIKINGVKKYFEFTKADAIKKANSLKKKR